MPSTMVVITPDSDRADLETCLGHLAEQARTEARRGYAGTRGHRYAILHANIDVILTAWELAS